MSNVNLTGIFVELYRKLKGKEPTIAFKESIQEIVENNALESSDNIPAWFIKFWEDMLSGKTGEVRFLFRDLFHPEADVVNFMAELANVIDMNYENYGEGIVMQFEPLNLDVFICFEGGPSSCFYKIRLLNENER
ncbi:MAG TPA: hypothetical protein VK325_07215 [Pseudoxanthomonas sp.]|nr:hypothetical protein [Pseudoxanthomonas sp.]